MATRRVRKKRQAQEQAQKLNMESVTWNGLTWTDIEKPTTQETEYLAQNYSFHPLDLDDCLSRIQRPKIDEYKEYLFLVLHFPVFNVESRATAPSQISVFIGENYLITLHKGDLKPLTKLFKECQVDEESRQEYFSQGPGYILYRILDRLVDYCLPILNKIGDNIERTEDNIFASSGIPKTIEDISTLRRDIISFRRTIWPMRAVLASLEPRVRHFTKLDLSVYFGDMVDHVDKIWDALDEYKEIVEGLNDTHDSLATNRTNNIVRMLTIIATILLPITVVSSIFGMNIPLPFQHSAHSLLYVILIMVAVIVSMLLFFRRQRWI